MNQAVLFCVEMDVMPWRVLFLCVASTVGHASWKFGMRRNGSWRELLSIGRNAGSVWIV